MPREKAKRTITDYLPRPKRVKAVEEQDDRWEKFFNEDLLVYQKDLPGSKKVKNDVIFHSNHSRRSVSKYKLG